MCDSHQIKYAGSDTDFSASPAFCKQISRVDSEEQKVIGTQTPLHELLEGLIADKELPAKDKRKRLKQVWKYPFEKKTSEKRNILKCRFGWRNIFEVLMLHCSCTFYSALCLSTTTVQY